MGAQVGYLDIENEELQKYFDAVEKKRGICRHLPRGRFSIRLYGEPAYEGLVCSNKMGGAQTGVGAEYCKNCQLRNEDA